MLKYQATNRLNGDVFIIEEICYALAKHLIFQRVNNLAWISRSRSPTNDSFPFILWHPHRSTAHIATQAIFKGNFQSSPLTLNSWKLFFYIYFSSSHKHLSKCVNRNGIYERFSAVREIRIINSTLQSSSAGEELEESEITQTLFASHAIFESFQESPLSASCG